MIEGILKFLFTLCIKKSLSIFSSVEPVTNLFQSAIEMN